MGTPFELELLKYQMEIKAQVLYDVVEFTACVSGQDLQEMFLEVIGEYSPSGNTRVSAKDIWETNCGRILFRNIFTGMEKGWPQIIGAVITNPSYELISTDIKVTEESDNGVSETISLNIRGNGSLTDTDRGRFVYWADKKACWTLRARIFFADRGLIDPETMYVALDLGLK